MCSVLLKIRSRNIKSGYHEYAYTNLQTKYKEEVAPALMETFGYSSPMAIPRLLKINLNQGVNGAGVVSQR